MTFTKQQVRLATVGGGALLDRVSNTIIVRPVITEETIDAMVAQFRGPIAVMTGEKIPIAALAPPNWAPSTKTPLPTGATLVKLEKQVAADGIHLIGTVHVPIDAFPAEHKWMSISVKR